jgi:glutamate formiminotransferase/formiminotetrahydrofolate cyclodeaminase
MNCETDFEVRMRIVECVPNFSEGRNRKIIESIAEAIRCVPGAVLLDASAGSDANRTVYSYAGGPRAVLAAAFAAVEAGTALIDMSAHRGAHPRLGACDVFPFVPVSGVSMESCAGLARRLGERVGKELAIPVYLYAEAARVPERRNLERIREGEYERLRQKLADPTWRPDYGPAEYTERVKKSGALVTGAREFLIAYNVNLDTSDRETAARIAGRIREKGTTVLDENGRKVRVPGELKSCKAIGWYVEAYGRAQVSVNLTDFRKTNMHHVFEAVKSRARAAGVRVTGSELVGLVPRDALLKSGRYYWEKSGQRGSPEEDRLIGVAIEALGLDDVAPFIPEDRVVEYRIRRELCT